MERSSVFHQIIVQKLVNFYSTVILFVCVLVIFVMIIIKITTITILIIISTIIIGTWFCHTCLFWAMPESKQLF